MNELQNVCEPTEVVCIIFVCMHIFFCRRGLYSPHQTQLEKRPKHTELKDTELNKGSSSSI